MDKIPVLSHRLKRIADLIDPCETCADIGTDHGLLPAYLLKKGIVDHFFAGDINVGPLNAARKTFSSFGVLNRADLILADGLDGIIDKRPEKIIIAGMGGETIVGILEPLKKAADYHPSLFLQPMSRQEKLRQYLFDNGYCIYKEILCAEGDKLYNILVAGSPSNAFTDRPLNDIDIYIGRLCLDDTETLSLEKEYLSRIAKKLKDRCVGLASSGARDSEEYISKKNILDEVTSRIALLDKTLD